MSIESFIISEGAMLSLAADRCLRRASGQKPKEGMPRIGPAECRRGTTEAQLFTE